MCVAFGVPHYCYSLWWKQYSLIFINHRIFKYEHDPAGNSKMTCFGDLPTFPWGIINTLPPLQRRHRKIKTQSIVSSSLLALLLIKAERWYIKQQGVQNFNFRFLFPSPVIWMVVSTCPGRRTLKSRIILSKSVQLWFYTWIFKLQRLVRPREICMSAFEFGKSLLEFSHVLLLPVSECPLRGPVLCSSTLGSVSLALASFSIYIPNVHARPQFFRSRSFSSCGHGLRKYPRYRVRPVSNPLASADIALDRMDMP